MSELAQHAIVLSFVLLAAMWLGRRAWATLHPRPGIGCGGCASHACGGCAVSQLASMKKKAP